MVPMYQSKGRESVPRYASPWDGEKAVYLPVADVSDRPVLDRPLLEAGGRGCPVGTGARRLVDFLGLPAGVLDGEEEGPAVGVKSGSSSAGPLADRKTSRSEPRAGPAHEGPVGLEVLWMPSFGELDGISVTPRRLSLPSKARLSAQAKPVRGAPVALLLLDPPYVRTFLNARYLPRPAHRNRCPNARHGPAHELQAREHTLNAVQEERG